ncbi:MAG: M36 family metallopeptidase, partial [Betaproteobacteria bacterium]
FVMGAPDTRQKFASATTLDANSAVAAALGDYKFAPSIAQQLQRTGAADGYTRLTLPAGITSADGAMLAGEARVKPVWFRVAGALIPAYYVELQTRDAAARSTDNYAYVISANDGRILFRHNQTAEVAFSYRVYAEADGIHLPLPGPNGRNGYPHPTGTPDGYQGPFVPPNLVTLESIPFSKNDPWLAPGATKTIGNNVESFTNMLEGDGFGPGATDECNLSLPVNGDMHACTNAGNTFDYVYDVNARPDANRSQVMAGVTNLFYMINFMHDWYYDAGFDEAAGNAQANNYGRGGTGNDSIFAEAQDYSGSNNASMFTPADGQRPRMRAFLWTGGVALGKVSAPATIAGVKQTGTAAFGAQAFDLSNALVQALDDANPTGPTTTDGCTPLINAAAVAGKIAVIDRGICTFVVKVKTAQNAGAAGVLIVNNVAPGIINMSGDDATISIPVLSVSLADGDAIKAQLAAGVSMRLARKSSVAREGALDNATIAHEWGHYISNRLVANSNGLTTNHAGGLGEGFADFHAMLLLVKEGDREQPANANFNGTYSDSAYPVSAPDFAPDVLDNAFYFGLRRFPYSRDMTKNPLTFRHISDGVALPTSAARSPGNGSSVNSEVHNTGEIWASMLWECYGNLLNDTGRLTFAQAQDRMKKYMVAGYKLMPTDPTLVEARDAILTAMQVRDPVDRDLCLHGFAKRGAGIGAVFTDRLSEDNKGVVESFMTVKPTGGSTRPVIEYYHAVFDHYFVTDIPDEITKLDNGTFVGWTRTGESFSAYASPPLGSAGVCRFFSTSFAPKSSHFYTPDVNECGVVKASADWQFEAVVFGVLAPGPTGNCPDGTVPVYRMYNNGQGAAPNHRYTTNLATRTTMLSKGWIPEGYGDLGVIMCSPT